MQNQTTAIILAAGYGKRLGGENQKTLTKILGKPLLSYLLGTLKKCHLEKIIVVVGFQKEKVMAELKNEPVIFVEQSQLLGTGHAVMMAKKELENFSGDVLILCGDVPFLSFETIQKIMMTHKDAASDCTILTAKVENPYGYGRIVRNGNGNVKKIVEEIKANDEEKKIREINTGVYVFNNALLFEFLEKLKPDPVKHEYFLTDVIELFIKDNKKITTWTTPTPEETIGINTPEDLQKAQEYFLTLRRKQ